MVRLGTVVLGADDVDRAVAFWADALGYEVVPFADSENDFTILRPHDGVGTRVAVQRSDTPVQERPRVHVDLVVDSKQEQTAEVDRLVRLGAARVPWDDPTDPDFVVLADTEGNRFCVVDASHADPHVAPTRLWRCQISMSTAATTRGTRRAAAAIHATQRTHAGRLGSRSQSSSIAVMLTDPAVARLPEAFVRRCGARRGGRSSATAPRPVRIRRVAATGAAGPAVRDGRRWKVPAAPRAARPRRPGRRRDGRRVEPPPRPTPARRRCRPCRHPRC